MKTVRACGLASCPVPEPDPATLRQLRTIVWPTGTLLRRGHQIAHMDAATLVPGTGATRFAPLADTSHVYVAATTFAALLETAFHDATPPYPRIPLAVAARWVESEVELRQSIRLIDLRDPALERLKVTRAQLVASSPAHYPCTRRWAEMLQGRRIGGQTTHGLVWHSRQTELHARAMAARPALRELLATHPAEVAVVWSPPAPRRLLRVTGAGLGRLDRTDGTAYVTDLVALLGIVSQ